MKKTLSVLNTNALKMIRWAWFLLLLNLFLTYALLPYAKFLYFSGDVVLGYILHRSIIMLFSLSAILAILALIVSVIVNITSKNQSILQRVIAVLKRAIITIPLILINGLAVLLLFVGKYIGLTLN